MFTLSPRLVAYAVLATIVLVLLLGLTYYIHKSDSLMKENASLQWSLAIQKANTTLMEVEKDAYAESTNRWQEFMQDTLSSQEVHQKTLKVVKGNDSTAKWFIDIMPNDIFDSGLLDY